MNDSNISSLMKMLWKGRELQTFVVELECILSPLPILNPCNHFNAYNANRSVTGFDIDPDALEIA